MNYKFPCERDLLSIIIRNHCNHLSDNCFNLNWDFSVLDVGTLVPNHVIFLCCSLCFFLHFQFLISICVSFIVIKWISIGHFVELICLDSDFTQQSYFKIV